jgi:Ca-activated chloride channel family protein
MTPRGSLAAAALALLVSGGARAQQPDPASGVPIPNPAAPPIKVPPPTGPRQGVTPRRVDSGVAHQAQEGTKALLDQRPGEAMVRYDQAQVKSPDLPELAYDRGLAALLAGKSEDAKKSFALATRLREEAAKKDPKHAPSPLLDDDARFNDAHASFQTDDLKGAVQKWASVVQGEPGADDARKNLELALRMLEVQQQQQQQQQNQQQPKPQDQDQKPQPQDQGQQQPQPQEPKPEQGDQPQPQQPQERPGEMSRDQAEQLLDALQAQEKQAMGDRQEKETRRAPASGKIW